MGTNYQPCAPITNRQFNGQEVPRLATAFSDDSTVWNYVGKCG